MKLNFKKILLICLLCITAIVAASYFFLTSNIFLSRIVVPALGRYLIKADYTTEHVKYNPFTSYLEAKGVLVGDSNNPFLTAKKASCYVNVFSLLNSTLELNFRDIYIEDIDINFIKRKGEKWSIPWMYKTVPPDEVLKFDVDFTNINITNMNIKYLQDIGYGKYPLEAELIGLNVSSERIKNGQLAFLKYAGKINIISSVTGIENIGNIYGTNKVNLAEWSAPSQVSIGAVITDIYTGKEYPKIPNRTILFDLDIIRQLENPLKNNMNLQIKDIINNKLDSALNASGQMNFYPFNFITDINANPIHAPSLRVFNNVLGNYDLGNATFSYLGKLFASRENFRSSGKLSLTNAVPTANNIPLTSGIPLDLLLNYSFDLDYAKQIALIKKLNSVLINQKEELVKIALDKPMPINYGKDLSAKSSPPPTINIRTTDLHLGILNKTIGDEVQILSGVLDSNINLAIAPNSKILIIKGETKTKDVILDVVKTNKLINLNFNQQIDIELENFKNLKFNKYELDIYQKSDISSKVFISGNYDFYTKKGKLHTLIPFINQDFISLYQTIPDNNEKISSLIQKTSPFDIYLENDLSFNLSKGFLFNVENLILIFSNPVKNSSLILTLLEHFSFSINKNKIVLNKDIVLNSDVKNADFVNIKDFLPESFPIKFKKGSFTNKLLLIVPKELNSLKIKGQMALLYSNLNFYNQYIRDLSVTTDINAVIYDTKAINLIDCTTELYTNGVQCLKAKTNGVLTFNKTKDSNLIITVEDINKYFANLFYEGISVNINSLKATGKILCRFTEAGNNTFINGEINMSKAVFGDMKNDIKQTTVNGNLKFDVAGTEKEFKIKKLNISLLQKKKEIVQLDASGNFPVPINAGISILSVNSNNVLLDKIAPIYLQLNRAINKTIVQDSEEYDPIDFKGLNLNGDVNLHNVTYGKLINSSYHSKLDIKNNKITLIQRKSQINGTDIKYQGALETNHRRGYPYRFNTEFNNLDLEPFVKTFVTGEYKKAGGIVNSFILSLQGKGFTTKSIYKTLKGRLDIKLSKLSVPYQIEEYNVLKFLLAPLVILEQIRTMLPGGFLVNNFEKGITATRNILNNEKNIKLISGLIMLTARSGYVELNKVEFLGEKNEPVNYSDFYGSIDYDGNLDIYSKSNISGLILPVYIDGTIKKPTPNFTFFIPKFLFLNILTILNPLNILDFVLDICIGVYKTFEGMAVYTWDLITSPFSSETPEKVEKKKENVDQNKKTADKSETEKEVKQVTEYLKYSDWIHLV